MSKTFFEHPILNSPYEKPEEHWELDESGQPTNRLIPTRRKAEFITPIPKAKKQRNDQTALVMDEGQGISDARQQYEATASVVNALRNDVDQWRNLPESSWMVSPETARLLKHWRHYEFQGVRPFFCQVEAVETVIWLSEVAPQMGAKGKRYLDHLVNASRDANPELVRLALKLATGAGKTTVMAMLIAWQTINAVRHPSSKNFTRGFLIVAPGITIKDRLRVLLPNDADSYYQSRELIPGDLLPELQKAKIVITNFQAFKLRERLELSKGTRSMLQGRGDPLQTLESEGQMIQRVMPDLMGLKNILIINDEAHHCYREKTDDKAENLKGDEKKEADENREAARLWINGLEAVKRSLGVQRVIDLSATPFFLSGSGYAEGTLFPWSPLRYKQNPTFSWIRRFRPMDTLSPPWYCLMSRGSNPKRIVLNTVSRPSMSCPDLRAGKEGGAIVSHGITGSKSRFKLPLSFLFPLQYTILFPMGMISLFNIGHSPSTGTLLDFIADWRAGEGRALGTRGAGKMNTHL